MQAKKMLGLLFILLIIAGCTADKSSDTQGKLVKASIINGQKGDKYEDEDLNLSIASIPVETGNCTGVLISSNVVLTAGHCIEQDALPSFIYLGESAPYYKNRHLDNENKYLVEKIVIHPSYTSDYNVNRGNYDLALIFLKEKAKAPFKPMKINDGFDFIEAGTPLHIAGFSWYSTPFITNFFDRLNNEFTERYRIRNYEADYSSQYLTKNIFMSEAIKPNAESDILYMTQFTGGLCSGDSGGPTMIKSDGHLFLVGINRSVRGRTDAEAIDCEFISIATSVSFHKKWINETLADAEADRPEFVSSIAFKDLDAREVECAKVLNDSLNTYFNLESPVKEMCAVTSKMDVEEYLNSLDKNCQSSCNGVRGFEGQCDFYFKSAKQIKESNEAKCAALL